MNEQEEVMMAVGRLYLEKSLREREMMGKIASLEEMVARLREERDGALRMVVEKNSGRE